jgi:hypothetical protein
MRKVRHPTRWGDKSIIPPIPGKVNHAGEKRSKFRFLHREGAKDAKKKQGKTLRP